jgi:hypothetical protein
MKLTGKNRSTRGETTCHFVHHKSHTDRPGTEPGLRRERPATNRLSHGTALLRSYFAANILFHRLYVLLLNRDCLCEFS